MSLPFRGSKRPLNLLIDTTSIKAEGEDKWNARSIPLTHASMSCRAVGGPNRRIWRKIHIGIDEETLEVRAVEVTTNNIGDAPMLPELLNQIPPGQVVGCVTVDWAYDTRKCHEAIAARDAKAVIPTRKNAKPWKPTAREPLPETKQSVRSDTWVYPVATLEWVPPPKSRRNETSRDHAAHNPVGQWMHCIKLLGQPLMARHFKRQVPEIQIRIAALNRYTTLGIPVTEPVG
jgi:hypothetical protein